MSRVGMAAYGPAPVIESEGCQAQLPIPHARNDASPARPSPSRSWPDDVNSVSLVAQMAGSPTRRGLTLVGAGGPLTGVLAMLTVAHAPDPEEPHVGRGALQALRTVRRHRFAIG